MASDPKAKWFNTITITDLMREHRQVGDSVLTEPPAENLLTGKLTYGGFPVRIDDSLKPGEVRFVRDQDPHDRWAILRADLDKAKGELRQVRQEHTDVAGRLVREREKVTALAAENACLKATLSAMMNVAAQQAPSADVKPLIEELRDTTQSRSVFARCNAVLEKLK